MLLTVALVAGVATAVALIGLLAAGHRWRRGGLVRSLAVAVPAAVVTGEVTARVWRLPSDDVLLAEGALVLAAVAVWSVRRDWNPVGTWFISSLAVAEVAYLACAAQVTVAGGLGPGATVLSAVLLVLETFGLALAASFAVETCDALCTIRWYRPDAPPVPLGPYRPFVSIHVAAYNEPPDMLIETIRSLEAIDYPDLEVVVVDNNTEDADVWKPVEEYCAGRPWARYVHVAPWPGYKAGALNLALDELTDPRAEIIAVVDADYLVDPSWLEEVVDWFADPRVAFVQGPQDYDEWEGDAYLTACHDAYAYFFTASMRVRNERNSAIFGGTMGLIRRSALEEVGGWDEWCITEDAELSVRLYAGGYHGVYVHRSYGRGIMPLTFSALKRQRFRWCFGGMQILRRHGRRLVPWFRDPDDHLTAAQRADFLLGGLQWSTDLVALGYTLVLAASLVTVLDGGQVGFRPLGGPAVVVPLALALAGAVRAVWALRVLEGITVRRAALAFGTWLALSLTVARAVALGVVRRDGVFLRTPKWRHDGGLVEALRATRAESALAAALAGGAVLAAVNRQPVLLALALWQTLTYAAAPAMAWLNLHTEFDARQQRRQRSEDRRSRLGNYEAHLARVATAVVVVGCGGLVWLAAHVPNTGDPIRLPERSESDAGPLGNMGLAPGNGSAGTPATTAPAPAPTATPVMEGTGAGAVVTDGTGSTAATATPTTAAPPTTASTTTTVPGVGNGGTLPSDTTPTRPTTPGGPPTSHPGGGCGAVTRAPLRGRGRGVGTLDDSRRQHEPEAPAMIRDHLESALRHALGRLGVEPPATITLERPARREHGDWSSNVALASAKAAQRNPRELATQLVDVLSGDPPAHVTKVEVAGPGFVNFHLGPGWLHDVLRQVVEQGTDDYGRHTFGNGERVMVEFVSANPTGPLHVGNGWFASYGDSVGRLLERTGHRVSREYYVNDTGGQIRVLGESLLARRGGQPLPERGYPSGFVKGLASAYDGPDDVVAAGRWAAERILGFIRHQLANVNITYDEWFSQASIEDSEAVADLIADLQAKGLVWEEDDALWLDTKRFGDPREKRVVKKSGVQGGDFTYLAGDLAYHHNKFVVRGFDRVINVWGADHQGQVSSLLAGVEALGVEQGRLEVRIGQMVSLAGGRIGKRLGNAVDLDDLVDDIGPDVMRLLSLVSSIDQSPTIDLDKVRAESRESPAFYIQYAYARIHSLGKFADEKGVTRVGLDAADLSLLTHERELDVLRTLSEFPDVVRLATMERAPHKVTAWVRELADRFHGFYHDCYVIHPDVPDDLTQARLWLVEAARVGLAVGLDLLGVSAPESM